MSHHTEQQRNKMSQITPTKEPITLERQHFKNNKKQLLEE